MPVQKPPGGPRTAPPLRRWIGRSAMILSGLFLTCLAAEWAFARCHLGPKRIPGLGNFPATVNVLPTSTAGSLRFAVLGDPEEGLGTYRHLMRKAREAGAAFVVITGDVSDRPTEEGFGYFNSVYRSLGADALPTFTAIGNHDENPLHLFREYFGPEYFSFLYRDCLFIFADNNHPRDFGYCSEFVRREIDRYRAEARHIFIVVHKPLINFRRRGGNLQDYRSTGGYLLEILDREKVDAVLSGHFHGYLRGEYRDTLLLVTGGGGGMLHADDAFFHLVLIDVDPYGIRDTVVRADLTDSSWDRLCFRIVEEWYPAIFGSRWVSPAAAGAAVVFLLGYLLARGWKMGRHI